MSADRSLPLLSEVMEAAARALRGSWNGQAAALFRKLGRSYVRDMRGYAYRCRSGSVEAARGRAFQIEASLGNRMCAFVLGYPRRGKSLSLDQLRTAAGKVSLRQAPPDPISVWEIQKPEGGVRLISSRGPVGRAANRMADDFLRANLGASRFEFSRRGRGREAAVAAALSSYENDGVREFVHSDVQNFFPSISKEFVLGNTPLPKRMIAHSILVSDETLVKVLGNVSTLQPELAVRAGLPLGSRSSAILASKIIESVLDQLDVRLALSHGDDVLAGTRDKSETDATINALAALFAQHPAGPFQLKDCNRVTLRKENDFLGYSFVRRAKIFGGYAQARPSKKAILRKRRRIARALALNPPTEHLAYIEQSITNWCRSFRNWRGREEGIAFGVMAALQDVLPIVQKFQIRLAAGIIVPNSLEHAQSIFDQEFLPLV